MVPKVDTFAMDISDEVKKKEATLADIATASNDIGNKEEALSPLENKTSRIFMLALMFLVFAIIGVIGFIYFSFFTFSQQPQQATEEVTTTKTEQKAQASLALISTTLNEALAPHITGVEKRDRGYIITIASYAPVFAYMKKNETYYITELLESLNKETPQTKTPTASVAEKSTTTLNTSSTTPFASSTESEVTKAGLWQDTTVSNITIRSYSSGDHSVAYAFASTEKLIIAKTVDDIVVLRGAILR